MSEPNEARRGKPEAVVFTASALEALADEIHDASAHIRFLAGDLRKKNRHGAIALNYFLPVTKGLAAMKKLVEEGENKIANGKVMTIVGDDSLTAQDQVESLRQIMEKTGGGSSTEEKQPSKKSGGARTPEPPQTPRKPPKK
jgi:hypothetical protein